MSGQHVKTEPLTLPGRIALAVVIGVIAAGITAITLAALLAPRGHEPAPSPPPVVRVIEA